MFWAHICYTVYFTSHGHHFKLGSKKNPKQGCPAPSPSSCSVHFLPSVANLCFMYEYKVQRCFCNRKPLIWNFIRPQIQDETCKCMHDGSSLRFTVPGKVRSYYFCKFIALASLHVHTVTLPLLQGKYNDVFFIGVSMLYVDAKNVRSQQIQHQIHIVHNNTQSSII